MGERAGVEGRGHREEGLVPLPPPRHAGRGLSGAVWRGLRRDLGTFTPTHRIGCG